MIPPRTGSPVRPLNELLSTHDSDSEEEEEWADAHDELPATASEPRPTEYPEGHEPEEKFTEEEMKELLRQADELKTQANDKFRSSDWAGAIETYKLALRKVPPRSVTHPSPKAGGEKGKGRASLADDDDEEDDIPSPVPTSGDAATASEPPPTKEPSPAEKACATARAVLNSNIAACLVKQSKHQESVTLCTEALVDDPLYVKALHRRATCNEALNTWNSLSDAEKDYKTLQPLLPPTSPLRSQVAKALQTLPARIEIAKKKETDEMMGKLKDLGNTVLGKFGLSTDNFKFQPNGQGGYSMNFVQ